MVSCTLGQGLALTIITSQDGPHQYWLHELNSDPLTGVNVQDPQSLSDAVRYAADRLRTHETDT